MSRSILVEYLLWARHYAKCPEKKKKSNIMINDVHVPTFSNYFHFSCLRYLKSSVIFTWTSSKVRDRHYPSGCKGHYMGL